MVFWIFFKSQALADRMTFAHKELFGGAISIQISSFQERSVLLELESLFLPRFAAIMRHNVV